ncbi:MAG: xanthine dehydrogenase [Chloroflexi bacterium HGW-Chloroflexi-2]|jgi:putative selenate reductase molybdopterin-binding subunit|nr:MAG: xanthine dehydrogenase [Chloroflexi bacterium HGW-Chloroflexi-2]
MNIHLKLNGKDTDLVVIQDESLLTALRRAGIWSVKHGCETGECGACSVLMDGKLVPTCVMLAPQADGHEIETVEGMSEINTIHPIQKAFTEMGAVQCGYCTPAMVLATKALINKEMYPTLEDARDALSSTICRCTGYVKPVEAIMRAAAMLRGEEVPPIDGGGIPMEIAFGLTGESDLGRDLPDFLKGDSGSDLKTKKDVKFAPWVTPESQTDVVGHPEIKVDAVKLAKGKPAFTDDINLPGMLYAEMLTSPHGHARIRNIDTSKAKALQGVHAVLTYKDIPRVIYASGGQSWPNPKPWDQVSLDNKVRFVGDRVAVVAAETPEIARAAVKLIDVDYEVLPVVLDPREAGKPGAPVIHDEPDAVGIPDASRNLVNVVDAVWNDVDKVFAECDRVFENTYYTPKQQQAHIEPHITITYWDEDERLVVRTSTQVPFHARRMLAPLIGLPVKRIRVIKPRIGGGFGGKQEMLIEDLAAHLTLATNRPVRLEYTREQEFTSSRSRHPMYVTFKVGVMNDGTIRALDMSVISDTGAYGSHSLTVASVSGLRGLSTYKADALRFHADIYYTNKAPAGAFRGYGAPQGMFGLEVIIDEIAHSLGFDPLEFRRKNAVNVGDHIPISTALGEGGTIEQYVLSCGLQECFDEAAKSIQWERRNDPKWRVDPERPHIRRGLGVATCMHGTAIPGLDMGGASIKMNDDGSFNVQVGATDLGTGSDTVIAQIIAETLGCRLEDIIIYSSDTDMTPFDVGAYASSTTFISGGSAKKAAEIVRKQIIERAAKILKTTTEGMYLRNRQAYAADGRSVSLEAVALNSLHTVDQQQIMGTASFMSNYAPPPFGAQFVEVEVDTETGMVRVPRMVMAVDCGTAINPMTASGQIEGGQLQALGMAISEGMEYDTEGNVLQKRFGDYRIYEADEAPDITAILVPTYEPSGPYGAKAVAEIPMDGVGPAVSNAIFDAIGVRLRELPVLPEKVWKGIQEK